MDEGDQLWSTPRRGERAGDGGGAAVPTPPGTESLGDRCLSLFQELAPKLPDPLAESQLPPGAELAQLESALDRWRAIGGPAERDFLDGEPSGVLDGVWNGSEDLPGGEFASVKEKGSLLLAVNAALHQVAWRDRWWSTLVLASSYAGKLPLKLRSSAEASLVVWGDCSTLRIKEDEGSFAKIRYGITRLAMQKKRTACVSAVFAIEIL